MTVEQRGSVFLSTVNHVSSNPIAAALLNQGDLILTRDMDACKTTPEPRFAPRKLAPLLNQVLQKVPFYRLNIPSYSTGAANKSHP